MYMSLTVFVAAGYEICEEFRTYYTYCDDGYECCGDYCWYVCLCENKFYSKKVGNNQE